MRILSILESLANLVFSFEILLKMKWVEIFCIVSSFWVSFQKPRAVHINYALDFILFVFVIFAGEKMLIFYCFLCLFVLLEIMLFCCDFLLYY